MALIAALITTAGCDPSESMATPIVDLKRDCGDLSFGHRSDCVKELQRLLNLRGAHLPGNGLPGNGYFGEDTLEGVQQFQRARGLPDGGLVSDLTKEALYDFPPQYEDWDLRTECIDLEKGAEGKCVGSLQRLLNQYGAELPDIPTYGPQTTEAVRQFQRDHNLPASGAVRSQTKGALYNGLPPGAPLNPKMEVHNCPGSECSVYMSRATTADIATAFDNPIFKDLATAFISQVACTRLKKLGIRVICDVVVQRIAEVIEAFRQARHDNECVRISFESTSDGFRPAKFSQTGGEHCQG